MSYNHSFTKENLDDYLKQLAKEYRKLSGKKVQAEIVLIGGAAVLINYGFREMTYDMDAIIQAGSAMKEAINHVGDRNGLPSGWLNDDFKKTTSFTKKIMEFSKYYRTFSNVVTYRIVEGEYLIAMKLMSGRLYKYDRSDVVGTLLEHKNRGDNITLERIKKAICDLYGGYDVIPKKSKDFIEAIFANTEDELEEILKDVRNQEIENKKILVEFQEEYPNRMKSDNIDDIINSIKKKKLKSKNPVNNQGKCHP